ncbi:MAG TPA: hypothetical protein VNC78_09055 [Actinomycetota bacterium]|nr:hypothetical protein [Actinomycetota bacterium]
MRSRYRYGSMLVGFALMAGLAVPTTTAVANHNGTLTVQVGGHFGVGAKCDPETFKGCRSGESMRFQAPNLRVHDGDTITFDFQGFHTATFLPLGTDLFHWIQSNTPGVTSPYSILVPDPDDTSPDGGTTDKPSVKANPAVDRPTDPSCGTTANPCTYNGSLLNSGTPQGESDQPVTFSATIDAKEGDVFWVLCLLHPHMFMKVTVVGNGVATTTQAEIDGARAANLVADEDWAESQHAKLVNSRSSHVTSTGQKVYDVYVGVDNHRAVINGMYPRRTSVPKGATVRFNFNELIYEHHTATMSFAEGLERGQQMFSPWCDPDGDGGPGPDTAAEFGPAPPCGGDFSKFEVDVPSPLWNVTGDGTFTGNSDFENSGVRGGLQLSTAPFDVRFTKASDRKGWKFFCLIHGPGMSGKVIVR